MTHIKTTKFSMRYVNVNGRKLPERFSLLFRFSLSQGDEQLQPTMLEPTQKLPYPDVKMKLALVDAIGNDAN